MYNEKTKGQKIGKNKLEPKKKKPKTKQEVEYPTKSCPVCATLNPPPPQP